MKEEHYLIYEKEDIKNIPIGTKIIIIYKSEQETKNVNCRGLDSSNYFWYTYDDNKSNYYSHVSKIKEIKVKITEEYKIEDNSRFLDPSNFKTLNYKDLDGKTLKMTVVDKDECLLVAGIDKETNTIYMLHSEVK